MRETCMYNIVTPLLKSWKMFLLRTVLFINPFESSPVVPQTGCCRSLCERSGKQLWHCDTHQMSQCPKGRRDWQWTLSGGITPLHKGSLVMEWSTLNMDQFYGTLSPERYFDMPSNRCKFSLSWSVYFCLQLYCLYNRMQVDFSKSEKSFSCF